MNIQNSLDVERNALINTYTIINELIDSAALDLSTEAKDCLEVFSEYDWVMLPGCDESKFKMLQTKGNEGEMSQAELDDFISMVSREGEIHVYYSIYQGQKAIKDYKDLILSFREKSAREEYKVVAISTGHLTLEDRDALTEAVNNGNQMILQRDYGFFFKLYGEELESNFNHVNSKTINEIVAWAFNEGYQMIEFDCDAQPLPNFPLYEW